jgi:hypothetical protein
VRDVLTGTRGWAAATGLVGALVVGVLAGCASATPVVHAPAFVVPTPTPMTGGTAGPAGTAEQANQLLTGWINALDGSSPGGYPAVLAPCGHDAGCLGLVATAEALPHPTGHGTNGFQWSYVLAGNLTPDPVHPDSWTVDARPYWQALDVPYPGHDGWMPATMLRFRLRDTGGDWQIVSVTPVPASSESPAPAPLTSPSVG